jgi:hypothetical protein
LLSIWFVELFNRQPPASAAQHHRHHPAALGHAGDAPGMLPPNPIANLPPAGAAAAAGLLPSSAATLRELRQDELAALLAAAGEARDVVAVLLIGLSTEEALARVLQTWMPLPAPSRSVALHRVVPCRPGCCGV